MRAIFNNNVSRYEHNNVVRPSRREGRKELKYSRNLKYNARNIVGRGERSTPGMSDWEAEVEKERRAQN